MKEFIAIMKLPDILNKEFYTLIPKQMQFTHKLMQKGIIMSYSLTSDRSKLFIVFKSENKKTAWDILYSLPLTRLMDVELESLFFHLSAQSELYQVSLN